MLCLDWGMDLGEWICIDLNWFVGRNEIVWTKGMFAWTNCKD